MSSGGNVRALIAEILCYTMDWVIETFRAIPDDKVCVRPRPNINAPGWIFGHIAVTERKHVGLALEDVDDIPEKYRLFHTGGRPSEAEIRAAIESKDALIDYWRQVRVKTRAYLESITDEDLWEVPQSKWLDEHGGGNRENPRREWFIMTIQHQNHHWGQLAIIEKMLRSDG